MSEMGKANEKMIEQRPMPFDLNPDIGTKTNKSHLDCSQTVTKV